MRILSIDPGCSESGYVLYDTETKHIDEHAKVKNDVMLDLSTNLLHDVMLIEMIASYGMAVGKEVFETCVWIGRFYQTSQERLSRLPLLIYRKDIKMHHCGSMRAKDSNIIQALKDKYGDKGTMKNKGFFYGFSKDVWQAFALASFYAETKGKQ